MRKFKKLAMPLTVLLSAIVSACGHVTVKDQEVCADLGVAGAHCAHTYITKRRDIPKKDWDRVRIGWMCTPANAFSDKEDAVDELCRTTNLCDYETQDEINKFKARMRPVLKKAKAARKLIDSLDGGEATSLNNQD